MDYAKLLTQGVGAWLHFENACGRSELFSEKYMASPIGQILYARSGNRVHAEVKHPVLAKLAKGPGRRPEIDFAVYDQHPKVSIAVESKWIGSTTPSVKSILWDLIRLEMIAHHEKSRSFFVLGGRRSDLDKLFRISGFVSLKSEYRRRPILRHDNNVRHRVFLSPVDGFRKPLLKDLFKSFQGFDFPEYIVTRRSAPFPSDQKSRRFQVYTWEVFADGRKNTFKPKNSRHYQISQTPSL